MIISLAAGSDDAVSLVHAGQQFLRLFIGNVVERGMCDNSLDVGRTFFGLSFDSLLLLFFLLHFSVIVSVSLRSQLGIFIPQVTGLAAAINPESFWFNGKNSHPDPLASFHSFLWIDNLSVGDVLESYESDDSIVQSYTNPSTFPPAGILIINSIKMIPNFSKLREVVLTTKWTLPLFSVTLPDRSSLVQLLSGWFPVFEVIHRHQRQLAGVQSLGGFFGQHVE